MHQRVAIVSIAVAVCDGQDSIRVWYDECMNTQPSTERIQMPQIYDCAPLDRSAQQITQGVVFVGGVLTLPGLFLGLSGLLNAGYGMWGVLISAAVAATLLVFVWLSWAGMPVRLEIHADAVHIRRRWWRRIRIPMRDISAVMRPVSLDVRRERWGFNVGVFGYQGPFMSERYGALFCMVTDRERTVAIGRTRQRLLVVSPQQPAGFVYALQEARQHYVEGTATEGNAK